MDALSKLAHEASKSPIEVLHVGLGPIGLAAARLAGQRSSLRSMAAVDIAPALLGKSLGELTEQGSQKDIAIHSDVPDVTGADGLRVALHATSSSLENCVDQLTNIARSGWNVVSSCEELSYPWRTSPQLAKRLDSVAAEAGVVIVGTGVNPGYMDYLPLALTGPLRNLHQIKVLRVQDAGRRRLPLQRKVGAGMTTEEFDNCVGKKTVRHVGLLESAQLLADALGFTGAEYKLSIAPILADVSTPSGVGLIAAGHVLGVHQTATACCHGKEVIKLELKMAVGLPPRDEITISGDPDMHVVVPGGIHGDTATEAMLINIIPSVLTVTPGLRVTSELPPSRPYA